MRFPVMKTVAKKKTTLSQKANNLNSIIEIYHTIKLKEMYFIREGNLIKIKKSWDVPRWIRKEIFGREKKMINKGCLNIYL